MYLKLTKKPNNRTFMQYVESYRDINSIPKQRVVEKIGYVDDFLDKYDDPIAHFRNEAKLRSVKDENLSLTIDLNEEIDDGLDLKNVGYFALRKIYETLGLESFLNNRQRNSKAQFSLYKNLMLLVISRVLYPNSKSKTLEESDIYFESFDDISKDSIYDSLDYYDKFSNDIQKLVWKNTKDKYSRDASCSYYDCTNYYFEIEYNDMDILDDDGKIIEKGLRKRGPEKNNRPDPIVEMGLLMDNNGIPMAYDIFPGNESEKTSLRPLLKSTKAKYGIDRTVVVADRGLNTSDNIFYLAGYNKQKDERDGYVYGQSIRGADKEFKNWAIDFSDYVTEFYDDEGNIVDTSIVTSNPNTKYTAFIHKSRIVNKTIKIEKDGKRNVPVEVRQKQMVYFSFKYKMKQKYERDKMVEKAKSIIKSPGRYNKTTSFGACAYINNLAYNKDDGTIIANDLSIDMDKIEEEEKYDGFYSIVTSELDYSDIKMRNIYRGLAKIEDTFKVSKTSIKSRPAFVWTKESIEGHFLTCYLALVIIRLLEIELDHKYSVDRMIDSLKKYNCTHLDKNIYKFLYKDEIIDDISKVFNVDLNKKYKTRESIKKLIGY